MPRTRLAPLAILLALLLPGLGGSWLSLGHPCPAAAAIATGPEGDASASGGHHDHGHDASHHQPSQDQPSPNHHDAHCDCLGACQGGAAPLVPAAAEFAVAALRVSPVVPANGWTTWFPLHTPLDLLPLPTAPPVA